jgi:hypothetical protein
VKTVPNYSEAESKEMRERFEAIVLSWPDVEKKMLFGSPSYATRDTSFAMLVTGGFILTQLDEGRKAALLAGPEADYFVGHGRVMKKWVVVRIQDPAEIERFVPFIEASYAAAAPTKPGKG